MGSDDDVIVGVIKDGRVVMGVATGELVGNASGVSVVVVVVASQSTTV